MVARGEVRCHARFPVHIDDDARAPRSPVGTRGAFAGTSAEPQPFRPEVAHPSMTRFCIVKNSRKIGAIAITEAAIMSA